MSASDEGHSASKLRLERTQRGNLLLRRRDGKEYDDVRVVLAWPMRHKDRYVCFVNEAGEQLAMADSLEDLDPDCRELVATEIERRYLVAVIRSIISLRMEHSISYWDVETDHGQKDFVIKETDRNPERLTASRWRIRDVSGNQFEILDVFALDARSRRFLRRLME